MRNIFPIPTENQTRLAIIDGRILEFDKFVPYLSGMGVDEIHTQCQYIYITSGGEINIDSDWIICSLSKAPIKAKDLVGMPILQKWYKIILTTDPNLIKEGVQSIPDEFLEWFVKNPTTEYVDVEFKPVCCNECDERLCYVEMGQQDPEYVINIPKTFEDVHEDNAEKWRKNQDSNPLALTHKIIEKLEKAFREGKTIQSKSSGEWVDFVRHNQLDSPNWDYKGVDNWRVKPDGSISECVKDVIQTQLTALEEAAQELYPTTIDSFTDTGIDMSESERLIFINGANWEKQNTFQLFKKLVVRGCFKTDRDYKIAKQTLLEVTGIDYEEEIDKEQ
jgi:hypothetical protein